MTLSIDSHCLPISAQTGYQRIFTLSRRSLRRTLSAGWRGCWENVRRKKNWRSGLRGFDWWVHPNRHVTDVFSAIVVFFVSLVSNTVVSATSVHERDSRMCSKDFLSYQGDSAHFFRLSVQCQVNHLLRLSYLLVCLSVMTLFEVSWGVKKCLRTPQMGIFFPTQSQVLSLKADYLCSLASCKRNFRHRPVTLSY